MELNNADLYRDDAVNLVLGLPETYPFSRKLGLSPNHPCPEIVKIYKVFLVEKSLDAYPKCIFYSLSYLTAKRFFYLEGLPNKKDNQNLVLSEYSHPALVGFYNDLEAVSGRIAKLDQWKQENGDINVKYEQRLLDNTLDFKRAK